MTPTALTPAGRRARSKTRPPAGGHRAPLREPSITPRSPRRVSGPVAPGTPSRVFGPVAPGTPSRVFGPVAPGTSRRVRQPRRVRAPLGTRSLAYIHALPDHALLDRIIRGRAWIPLLGVLLAGIVAMQVEVLKLNAGIGRSLERATTLQTQNEQLRASVAQLADGQRIESMAAHMGMVMSRPAAVQFLNAAARADVSKAVAAARPPAPASFASALAASGTSTTPTSG